MKTFSAMPTHIINVCVKKRNIVSHEIGVNGQTTNGWTMGRHTAGRRAVFDGGRGFDPRMR